MAPVSIKVARVAAGKPACNARLANLNQHRRMPCIAQLPGGIKIEMYPGDHPPPHFHARHGGDVAKFRIVDMTIFKGSLRPAAERAVRTWAAQSNRQEALALNWVLCETLQKPRNIP